MEMLRNLTIGPQKEENKNEYVVEERCPPVRTSDLNNGLVKVELLIPGLEPGRDKYHPKRGKIDFDFNNGGFGFDMEATIKDTTNKKITIYKFMVKKLPGRIDIQESKWDVEKGKIVVMMEKHSQDRNVDWDRPAFGRGLDQASSSSSSSSSDSDDS